MEIKLKKNAIMLILAFAFVLTIVSTSAAAINETGNTTNTSIDLTSDCTGSDPIINGTVTVNEYGHVRPLEGATVIVNSTTGRVLASTTTDANGYYFMNFYSTDTTFNVIASYMGCTPISRSVTVNNGPNYPTDPNKYATQNFQLTPKSASLTSLGNGANIFIQGKNENGFAGVINVRVDGQTYVAYCIDLFTPISTGDTLLVNGPLPGTAGDLPDGVDWGKVTYILNHYNPSNDNEAAAIQCAIWYFTSAPYGAYNPSAPVGTYYQFMTAPNDGTIRTWHSWGSYYTYDRTIQNRVNVIIGEAISIDYPYSVEVTPEQTTIANGNSVTITTTVRDVDGNPLSGITVNFQTTRGTLNRSSATTDANGRVTVTLSSIGNNRNAVVTAYVSGNYGNLLYDDQFANTRKQNLVARNVLPLTLSGFSIINTAETANVELTQTANTPVNVGDTVTYTVTATNQGPSTATGILINDIVPAGLSGVTVTPSVGTYYNGIWTIPTLNNGASATLTITGTATTAMAGLTTTNTATRTSQEQYNNRPTTTTAGVYTKIADVTVNQTVNGGSSATVNVNDTVTYIITAVNNGVDAATNLQITDLIPSGLTDLSYTITGTGTYNPSTGLWNIGILNSGATTILTITGKVTAAMAGLTTTNYANRTSQTEYNPSPASTSTTVYTKLSDPIITQTVNGQNTGTVNVNVGDDVTFVVNAYCSGPDDATNIQIRDIVPAGLTGVTVTPSVGTYDSNTGIWTIPFLEKFTSATLTITGKAGTSMAGTSITNRATEIFQTEYNPAPGDSTSIPVYTKMADVTLSQTGNYQGNVVNFVVTATNNGPDKATNIKITDLIPSGLTGVTVTPSIGTYDPNTGVWTIPELLDGASATLTITGTATPQTTVTNTAEKTSQTEYDPNPEITEYGLYVPSVSIYIRNYTANAMYDSWDVNNCPVFVADVQNNGPNDATNVQTQFTIGEGIQFIAFDTRGNGIATYDPITRTITWNIGCMPNGGRVYMDIFTKITKSGTINTLHKLTHVTQTNTDTTHQQRARSINANLAPVAADIEVTQTVSNNNPINGDTITITITAKNNGPDNATGIQITDLLPTGLIFQSANTHGTGTYNETTGIWDIGTLNNGTTATLTITVKVNTTGTIINSASKTAPDMLTVLDWNLNNNSQEANITVGEVTYTPSVSIYIRNYTANAMYDSWDVNNCPVFVADVQNNGPNDATNVQTQFTIGEGIQFIAFDTRGNGIATYDPITRTITWNIGCMPNGGRVYMDIFTKITKSGTINTLHKLTHVTQTNTDTTHQQRARSINANLAPVAADIEVTQTVSNNNPINGDTITITITAKNNGPDNATGIQITDLLPTGLIFQSANTHGTGTYNETTGIWDIGTLNNGTTATLTITVKVNTTGTIINSASKTAPDMLTVLDWNLNNNSQEAIINVSHREQI
ncbi:MAG: Ig-like domain-containing protein [Methanobacterium sp.]|nr:Ig-like domain-containing protein [Methanobacterium sp.]